MTVHANDGLLGNEAVEAAAHELAKADGYLGRKTWELMDLADCLAYRKVARAALDAAVQVTIQQRLRLEDVWSELKADDEYEPGED